MLVPRNAYCAYVIEGEKSEFHILNRNDGGLIFEPKREYIFDYLEAKQKVKQLFGNKAQKALLTKVCGLLDMNCVDLLDEDKS